MRKASLKPIMLLAAMLLMATSACAHRTLSPATQEQTSSGQFQVDTVEVMSNAMGRIIKNVVVVPMEYIYYKDKEAYLQGQLGNPEGEHAPNKKYYDPRVWLRKGQEGMIARLQEAFEELGSKNSL